MGGVAGHMSHLYENPELTFKQIKDIFTKASNGELEGTEKTDGQNLFISYSVRNKSARAARNKGNIKSGGMSAQELAQKFAGRGNLEKAFVESFETFEKAVQSLDPDVQVGIFGEDADIYYNAEIQDPRTANVVNYDTKTLNIHQVGHAEFDKETGTVTDADVSKNAVALDNALSSMQQAVSDDEFKIQKNAILKLRALDGDKDLKISIDRLERTIDAVGISDNQTVADYIIARITPFLESQVQLPDDKMEMLIKRLFKVKGVGFNQIVKGLDRDNKERVREILKSEKALMKSAIEPIEDVVHDFTVEMLRGLESAFILDNPKEVMRLRQEVQQAIAAIETSDSEEAMEILQQQMRKLKSVEDISTAVEGFVFDYDGNSYKFTGNFAPMNQILGLFRYGRGGTGSLNEDEEGLQDYDIDISDYNSIALVPGGFKPPHRGHLDMVKSVANADRVLIIMGSGGKSPRKIGDRIVDFNMAANVWDMYLKDAGINNYEIVKAETGSTPIGKAFNILEDMTVPGQTVLMLTSQKDAGRFGQKLQAYAPEGVDVKAVEAPTSTLQSGDEISARFMRASIENNNFEEFAKYVPDSSKDRAEEIFALLGGKKKVSEIILDIVESLLDEAGYQTSATKKAYMKNWRKMMSTGPQKAGPPFTKNRPKKVSKSAPAGFGALEEDDIDEKKRKRKKKVYMEPHGHQDAPATPEGDIEETTGVGAVAGYSAPFPGPRRRKKKKKNMSENNEFIDNVLDYLLRALEQ